TLPLLESTALEWVARRKGFSRAHIHPTRFDRERLRALQVGDGMRLVTVTSAPITHWSLMATWQKLEG
ncbi:MAG: hypothetical protein ACHREM_30155, partial [Polyangiales bacterium]